MQDSDKMTNDLHGDSTDETRPAKTALIVDPDLRTAQRLAEALRDLCPVEVVPTGGDALGALGRQVPAILVTELDLPDMDGLQLLARVRGDPGTSNILVVVVTARTAAEEKVAAFDTGADDVLVKPVDGADLKMHVQMLTRFRRLLDQ
jgi:DNA-binding response OmpR family regulator